MKITIINCFDTYEHRVELLYGLLNKEYDVHVISSNFRHFKKEIRTEKKSGYTFLNVMKYRKNFSVTRLYSHSHFAKDAIKIAGNLKPDLLYVLVPPNSLVREAILYKRRYSETKIIFDIIDLWPETMPIQKWKNSLPFLFWKNIRNKYIGEADYIITECDLYKEKLKNVLIGVPVQTVYLARNIKEIDLNIKLNPEVCVLCYLGSINNIIDIDSILDIIVEIKKVKPVEIKIIGDGEKKELFIRRCLESGATVKDCGVIYSPKKKQEIFNTCDYGLNIMKESVCVGLTMKSIDYFEAGLPIINNIKGDTWSLVEEYEIGLNIGSIDVQKMLQNNRKMRMAVRKMFCEKFGETTFKKSLNKIINEINKMSITSEPENQFNNKY